MKGCNEHDCMCAGIENGIGMRIDAIQATSTGSGNKLMDDGETVVFDTEVASLTGNVTLDATTGVFTVLQGGTYFVNYYVNVDGTGMTTNVSFAVNIVSSTASSAVQGQMSGFALLQLQDGDTLSLVNSSGQQVLLANSAIQAGILIRRN